MSGGRRASGEGRGWPGGAPGRGGGAGRRQQGGCGVPRHRCAPTRHTRTKCDCQPAMHGCWDSVAAAAGLAAPAAPAAALWRGSHQARGSSWERGMPHPLQLVQRFAASRHVGPCWAAAWCSGAPAPSHPMVQAAWQAQGLACRRGPAHDAGTLARMGSGWQQMARFRLPPSAGPPTPAPASPLADPSLPPPSTHPTPCRRLFEGEALLRRMYRYGFLDESQNKLDYVLALTPADVLERRLQARRRRPLPCTHPPAAARPRAARGAACPCPAPPAPLLFSCSLAGAGRLFADRACARPAHPSPAPLLPADACVQARPGQEHPPRARAHPPAPHPRGQADCQHPLLHGPRGQPGAAVQRAGRKGWRAGGGSIPRGRAWHASS